MPRVLLLLPTTSYRTPDFLAAASTLGLDVTVASEEASTMERLNPSGLLTLDFADLAACADRVAAFSASHPIGAVVGVDEATAVAAAAIAERLGLPHNPVASVSAAGNKAAMRRRLAHAGVPSPRHRLFRSADDPRAAALEVDYPCVLKPTFLAASRGGHSRGRAVGVRGRVGEGRPYPRASRRSPRGEAAPPRRSWSRTSFRAGRSRSRVC